MRFLTLFALLPLLQVSVATFGPGWDHGGGHGGGGKPPAYCGTTTITKEDCRTSTVKAPAVTKTFTKDKQICFTTEYGTKVATVTSKVHVTETITHRPTETITKWAPGITSTKTKTQTKTTCSPTNGSGGGYPQHPGGHYKRAFAVEEGDEVLEEEAQEEEYISNAERLQRGLPLNAPVDKRTWGHWGHDHPKPPPQHQPSCVPSTTYVTEKTEKTKTVTPTVWTTTQKCRYTHTVDIPKWSTSTITKTKTDTKTVEAPCVTTKITKTPDCATQWKTITKTTTTGACKPTHNW